MASRYEVEDKVVLITGAAHGIGREAAARLAERGARLALIDRDAEGIERAASEIGAEPFVADVGEGDSLAGAIAAVRRRFGGIDVAIANAGVSGRPAPVTQLDDAEFERVVQINLLGVWRTLRAVLPDVIERRGYLLPIASLAAAVPVPLAPAYGASKAGVHSLARSLRMELAHTGVRVGCGYFGFIDTGMTRDAFADASVACAHATLPPLLGRPLPVGAAGAAIVRGVERRAKRVCAPRWVSLVVSLHGLGGPLEALAARDPRIVRSLRRAREAEGSPVSTLEVQPEEAPR